MNRKLKARIVEQFGTQGNFSQIAGITGQRISGVIRGKVTLPSWERKAWARALECEPERIFEPMVKRPCACGCGKQVEGRKDKKHATDFCRNRMKNRRAKLKPWQ